MATEPVTLFAQVPNPRAVIDVLEKMGAKFSVTGSEDAWSEIVVTTGGWLRKKQLKINHDPAYYTGQGWQAQMQGMAGYFSQFPSGPGQARVIALTGQFHFALGTMCMPDAEVGDERYAVLAEIAEALDAVWFTPSSLRDAQGRILYGASAQEMDAGARWPAYTPAMPVTLPAHSQGSEGGTLKQRVFEKLGALGFRPANSLPLPDLHAELRTPSTLCARLLALKAVFTWAAVPEDIAQSARLLAFIERNHLRPSMTESERALIDAPRQEAQRLHAGTVGWKLENMWALAWVVGFEPAPALDAGQIPETIVKAMLLDFLPGLDGDVNDFAASVVPRSASDVIYLEYLFYCAHNAVRSAQMGGQTVPPGFDPIAHGGAVHERRHSLTWSLAPGVEWDETDLST